MKFSMQPAAAIWLACLGVASVACGQKPDSPPLNVIVVMTDEHNFRTLGCYRETMEPRQAYMWGPAVVETPHIDGLARRGAMCTSCYATSPVCSPSRASFVTGLYPQATPVVNNNIPLDDDTVTFAALLAARGYATGFAGKWHLDGAGKPQWAPERQFGFQDNRYMFNRGHWKKFEVTDDGPRVASRNTRGQPNYDVDNADASSFSTDWLMDRTLEFVDQHHDQPFAYMLSLPDPHGPDTVRAPYDSMYDDQTYEMPTTFEVDARAVPQWGQPAQRTGFGQGKYYGMVKCIDDNVGRLIRKLEALKILDRTLIVFTSDHGDLRGEHHRQNKGVAFEGSARIPFLLVCPGKVAPGTVVPEALGSVDFVPTLLGLLDVESDQPFHGRDASPLLTGAQSAAAGNWDDIAFVRSTREQAGWLMAVTDRYKLVVSDQEDPWLFDLERDPDELVNQRDNPAYRSVIQLLGQRLQKYAQEYDDPKWNSDKIRSDLQWAAGTKKYAGDAE